MASAKRKARRERAAREQKPSAANVVRIDAHKSRPAGPRLAKRAYEGASNGRLSDGWFSSSSSADTEIWSAARTLRDRSRDLVRNNPHAAAHVVGLHFDI